MPLFGSSDKTYNRQAFNEMMTGLRAFGPLRDKFGPALASDLLGMYFEDAVAKRDETGFWKKSGVRKAVPVDAMTEVKVKGADIADFKKEFGNLCQVEDGLVEVRRSWVVKLLGQAKKGDLRKELDKNVEPLNEYFQAPAPAKVQWRQVGHMRHERVGGAPPAGDKEKALAWFTKGVKGDSSAYKKVLDTYVKTDGTSPLGVDDKIATAMWRILVSDAPRYRSTVLGSTYPSSVGGAYLLKWLFDVTKKDVALPRRGDTGWEDWSLFYFGSIMAAQPFPDGNKRAGRATYALFMLSAGIPFRAPTDAFGKRLANM